jgi:hypothetical protein
MDTSSSLLQEPPLPLRNVKTKCIQDKTLVQLAGPQDEAKPRRDIVLYKHPVLFTLHYLVYDTYPLMYPT